MITNGYFSISLLNCPNIKIGRIDIQFIRPNKTNETDVNEFLEKSLQVCKDGIPQRDENDDIQTLAISKREYASYRRIYKYKMDSALKFELEFKHRQTKLVQDYLFCDQLSIFEHELVHQYFKYSRQVLNLNYPYTDWVYEKIFIRF